MGAAHPQRMETDDTADSSATAPEGPEASGEADDGRVRGGICSRNALCLMWGILAALLQPPFPGVCVPCLPARGCLESLLGRSSPCV